MYDSYLEQRSRLKTDHQHLGPTGHQPLTCEEDNNAFNSV